MSIGEKLGISRIGYWDSLAKEASKHHLQLLQSSALNNVAYLYQNGGNFDSSIKYYNQSLELREALKNIKQIAWSKYNIATLHKDFTKFIKAIELFKDVIEFCIQNEIKDIESYAYNDLSIIYMNQGNIPSAITMLNNGLRIQESLNDTVGIGSSLNNLAAIYFRQGDINQAIVYYEKCIKIYTVRKNIAGLSLIYNNLSAVYSTKKMHDQAIEYINKSLELRIKLNDQYGIAACYNNIGSLYIKLNKYDIALEYFLKALKIKEKLGDKVSTGVTIINIAEVYHKKKQNNLALKFAQSALSLAYEAGSPDNISDATELLYKIYKEIQNFKESLKMLEIHISMRDSINNETTRKASLRSQLKYEYEKQAAADSVAHAKENEIKNVEIAKQTAEIKAKKNQQYALFGGLGLVIIFAGFMFNRYKVTQNQKQIIEIQKHEVENQKTLVEEKQKEILDSIKYARRIQIAHLPNDQFIAKSLERLKK